MPSAQQQQYPGETGSMRPSPQDEMAHYEGRGLLTDKCALITGGDSGIGRAIAVAFAKEGADVAIAYLDDMEDVDAEHTAELVREQQRRCVLYKTDLGAESACHEFVTHAARELDGVDVLVNHAGTQTEVESFSDITTDQFDRTFQVNVYAPFWLAQAALSYMSRGSAIINTGSVNGLRGNKNLIDYAASKGAIHVLTMSMAQSLAQHGIRVNCVAPGPVWTPLIPSTLPTESVADFGTGVPLGRSADPDEIAPSYVFFAANQLSSYYTGEVLAPVGGETHPG